MEKVETTESPSEGWKPQCHHGRVEITEAPWEDGNHRVTIRKQETTEQPRSHHKKVETTESHMGKVET